MCSNHLVRSCSILLHYRCFFKRGHLHCSFLASDAVSTLRGERAGYHATLLRLHTQLGLKCPRALSAASMESEVFLHVLHHCRGYLHGDAGKGGDHVAAETIAMADGDGGTGPGRCEGDDR